MVFKTLIGANDLAERLGSPRLCVVDCRFDLLQPDSGRQDYLRAHIPGARYADLNRDLSAPVGPNTGRHPLPSPAVLAAHLGALGIGNDAQVIAYDAGNGSFAARLWWLLRWLGHAAVAVLDGGFQAWTAAGGAVESGEPCLPAAANFIPRRIDADSVMSAAQLETRLREGAALLLDARAPERFAGAVEPIDAVAGHIPGAVNHPFTANLGADGRFLSAAELQDRWRRRLAGADGKTLVAMCGSGVTACHNLLSLEIAGIGGGQLYAGSWSEWIRDPRRPVERS
jgi:thiosulfate/3-mercaptopyruvate sulfurtransferase